MRRGTSRRRTVTTSRSWSSRGPGEADFLGKIATSDHEVESRFKSMIEDVHPMDFSNPPPMPTREL
jgi:hypothetical protein